MRYKDNRTEQSPQRSNGHKDWYVGRALDRLTVATMMLCRDSAQVELGREPASAGSLFFMRLVHPCPISFAHILFPYAQRLKQAFIPRVSVGPSAPLPLSALIVFFAHIDRANTQKKTDPHVISHDIRGSGRWITRRGVDNQWECRPQYPNAVVLYRNHRIQSRHDYDIILEQHIQAAGTGKLRPAGAYVGGQAIVDRQRAYAHATYRLWEHHRHATVLESHIVYL